MNALRTIALSAVFAGAVSALALAQTSSSGTNTGAPALNRDMGAVAPSTTVRSTRGQTTNTLSNGIAGSSGIGRNAPSSGGSLGSGQTGSNPSNGLGGATGTGMETGGSANGGVGAANNVGAGGGSR